MGVRKKRRSGRADFLDVKTCLYRIAGGLQVAVGAGRDELYQQIAQRRALGWAGKDRQAGRVGGHLVEVVVLAAAADDVQACVGLAGQSLQLLDRAAVIARERVVDDLHDLAGGFGVG